MRGRGVAEDSGCGGVGGAPIDGGAGHHDDYGVGRQPSAEVLRSSR
jgi:hypothetical protein